MPNTISAFIRDNGLLGTRKNAYRVSADFLLVHLSMITALAVTLLYHLILGQGAVASTIAIRLTGFYLYIFVPVSPLFLAVFYLNGFYTTPDTVVIQDKVVLLTRGTVISIGLFLAANYLLFPQAGVPRSVAVAFSVLLPLGINSSRIAKLLLLDYYERSALNGEDDHPDTYLVVGGAGYIGSILVRDLLSQGHRVRVLDSLVYGDSAIIDICGDPRFELIPGDCRNIKSVVAAVKGCKAVVHLAAIVGDPACEQERQAALEINYAATRMLIEIAKGEGVERLIFASSCSVYGATDQMMDEHSPVNPISLYARTKIDSERALLEARTDSFHPVILRFATVFGNSHRPRFDLVVNLLTAKAYQEGVITIYNGHQWRPFIHVRDICCAIGRVIAAPTELVSGQIFNVGDNGLNATLSDVATSIQRQFPDTRVEHIDNCDRRNYRVSFDKIHSALGFSCRYTLDEGILELKAAFDSRQITDYTDVYYSNLKSLQQNSLPTHATQADAQLMAAFSVTAPLSFR
jgi:nucleoside-diphosphate-sugar epimerase